MSAMAPQLLLARARVGTHLFTGVWSKYSPNRGGVYCAKVVWHFISNLILNYIFKMADLKLA